VSPRKSAPDDLPGRCDSCGGDRLHGAYADVGHATAILANHLRPRIQHEVGAASEMRKLWTGSGNHTSRGAVTGSGPGTVSTDRACSPRKIPGVGSQDGCPLSPTTHFREGSTAPRHSSQLQTLGATFANRQRISFRPSADTKWRLSVCPQAAIAPTRDGRARQWCFRQYEANRCSK